MDPTGFLTHVASKQRSSTSFGMARSTYGVRASRRLLVISLCFLAGFIAHKAVACHHQCVRIQGKVWAVADIQPKAENFFGLWIAHSSKQSSEMLQHQIDLWARSILHFHPMSIIWLFISHDAFGSNTRLDHVYDLRMVRLHNHEWASLFLHTPLHEHSIDHRKFKPAEFSDAVRLALLYRFGGSWVDVDDIILRPFPVDNNVIGVLDWPGEVEKSYFGSSFKLVNGTLISQDYRHSGFHVQNDPMLRWDPGNKFLWCWMDMLTSYPSKDWGQKIPTDILLKFPRLVSQAKLRLVPQHFLLLHPAFAPSGGKFKKGKMFPPHDYRVDKDFPDFDGFLTETEARVCLQQAFVLHSFSAVKNTKLVGTEQCLNRLSERWIIGWLACARRPDSLFWIDVDRGHLGLNMEASVVWKSRNENLMLGLNLNEERLPELLPSKVYNPSILKVSSQAARDILRDKNEMASDLDEVCALTWFVRPPNFRTGCLIWFALARLQYLRRLIRVENVNVTHDELWIISPTFMENILGPKLADSRLFFTSAFGKAQIGLIGYARMAPHSMMNGIADYYVRASVVDFREPRAIQYDMQDELECDFGDEEVGCFPANLDCDVQKVLTGRNKLRATSLSSLNLQPYLDCSPEYHCRNKIFPHHSRNANMPNSTILNGVEVPFLFPKPNEFHIARKNVVPVISGEMGSSPDTKFSMFVDFSSPVFGSESLTSSITNSKLVITDLASGVLVESMDIHLGCIGSEYRGSTQIIELPQRSIARSTKSGVGLLRWNDSLPSLWATVVHKRLGKKPAYDLKLLILSGMATKVTYKSSEYTIEVPSTCLTHIDLNDPQIKQKNSFMFPTGLIVSDFTRSDLKLSWEFLMTSGVGNAKSSFDMFVVEANATYTFA